MHANQARNDHFESYLAACLVASYLAKIFKTKLYPFLEGNRASELEGHLASKKRFLWYVNWTKLKVLIWMKSSAGLNPIEPSVCLVVCRRRCNDFRGTCWANRARASQKFSSFEWPRWIWYRSVKHSALKHQLLPWQRKTFHTRTPSNCSI